MLASRLSRRLPVSEHIDYTLAMLEKTMAGSFKLFRVFGITVYLHYLWFVLIIFHVLYQRGVGEYQHVIWNVAEILTLFAIVLLHEFGHALACRSVGGKAERILLWPLGGIAFVSPPLRPGAWLWSLAAGPLVNVVLLPLTLVAAGVINQPSLGASADAVRFVNAVTLMNLVLLVFNLLPIYPLDGGQIAQAILWYFIGFAKALRIVAIVGVVAAAALAGLFIYTNSFMGVLIAVFIGWQSLRGFQLARNVAASGDIP